MVCNYSVQCVYKPPDVAKSNTLDYGSSSKAEGRFKTFIFHVYYISSTRIQKYLLHLVTIAMSQLLY